MNDPEIRALLYPLLLGGVRIDELPTGTTRADVVHVTAQFMHGYEVKGDGDTLLRVANQLRCYGEVYDFVTFIVTEKHLPKLLPLLPVWVGVLVASAGMTMRGNFGSSGCTIPSPPRLIRIRPGTRSASRGSA